MPLFFFFNSTATTEIYTLSLHDALPIYSRGPGRGTGRRLATDRPTGDDARRRGNPDWRRRRTLDRKSTRLNSSHRCISYAVFCLKKKIQKQKLTRKRAPNLITRVTARPP